MCVDQANEITGHGGHIFPDRPYKTTGPRVHILSEWGGPGEPVGRPVFNMAVPELTGYADIQLNNRLQLRCRSDELRSNYRTIVPKSGSTPAKPSGDHTPLGGSVLEHPDGELSHCDDRQRRPSRRRSFICDNDNDAIVWAKLVDDASPRNLERRSLRRSPRTAIKDLNC